MDDKAIDSGERLRNLIARFVLKYNYWGYLFSRVKRQPAYWLPSIMGVAPTSDGTINLLYHPDLVAATDDENLTRVIEHEGLHILNKHPTRLLRALVNEITDEAKFRKSRIWNHASDCCVNQQAKFPAKLKIAGMDWPLDFPQLYDLPPDKTTEYYYLEMLKKAKDEENGKGAGKGKGDGEPVGYHGKWAEALENSPDPSALIRKIEQHVKKIIKESAKTFTKDRGNLPSHIQELIQEALLPPKAPYYQIIKKLIKASRFSKFQRSPTRINRKRAYTFMLHNIDKDLPIISPFPGKMRDFTFDICVMIDTSGSMSVDDIKEGLSGVKNIIENDRYCRTTVLEVDAGVEKEYQCKKIRDIQFNIKGRGGTTLFPGLARAKELGCDVCLAFTDGYTENINGISRKLLPKKLIWVITQGGTARSVNRTGFVVDISR